MLCWFYIHHFVWIMESLLKPLLSFPKLWHFTLFFSQFWYISSLTVHVICHSEAFYFNGTAQCALLMLKHQLLEMSAHLLIVDQMACGAQLNTGMCQSPSCHFHRPAALFCFRCDWFRIAFMRTYGRSWGPQGFSDASHLDMLTLPGHILLSP